MATNTTSDVSRGGNNSLLGLGGEQRNMSRDPYYLVMVKVLLCTLQLIWCSGFTDVRASIIKANLAQTLFGAQQLVERRMLMVEFTPSK